MEFLGLGEQSQLPTLKGVRRVYWKLWDRLGRGTSLLNYTVLHSNPTNKLVKSHSAPFWCWDKPRATLDSLDSPRPGLGGSHHLPPYSILYSSPLHLHPNGSFSRDSQNGIPNLSWFGLPGLWTRITFRLELGSGQSLNQSCSSPRELFNDVSHFACTHQNQVDSWLLVVGSQIANLTPDLSFDHNLCCRCPNGYTRPFWTSTLQDLSNGIKNTSMWGVLATKIALWVFESHGGLPCPTFGSVSGDLTLPSKWGCDNRWRKKFALY